ncbi:alkane 1-monooxygenase [Stylonychia lemnae]|uniref:Alkane 1-monooxygenase n=1 Tax=Stylonychia lemnae TaxID=5949 RepID=A0A078AP09_STYLE|nr:alkane 1-monooxygenase [Stylonychia lemnae]|eukprot:CDW84105.1 alkane 1-monooxygenase [Stylonychia lemnae]
MMKSQNTSTIQNKDGEIIDKQTKITGQVSGAKWTEVLPYFVGTALILSMYYMQEKYNNIFFGVWIIYAVVPILDHIVPHDNYNLPEKEIRNYEKDSRFLIPLYTAWAADFLLYFWGFYLIVQDKYPTSPGLFLALTFGIANAGALNLSIGHELVHRRELVHKILGNLVYSKMLYSHFIIQHIKSHHKKVATFEDPSSARKGESIWDFLFRTVPEGFVETWELEKNRLQQEVAVYKFFGVFGVVYQIVYSIFDIIFFETINYVEHYGLQRKLDSNGNYESIKITHSWNAPQAVTNYFLFKLQRHSDHHAHSYKPYQILESLPESPCLPFGYSATFLMAYVPFVWFKVMDPYVDSINKNEKMSEEVETELKRWCKGLLIVISILVTYITFFVIGFTPNY